MDTFQTILILISNINNRYRTKFRFLTISFYSIFTQNEFDKKPILNNDFEHKSFYLLNTIDFCCEPLNIKKYVFFVSHSTKDIKGKVGEVCYIFEKIQIKIFVADKDVPVGKPLPEEIKRAIEESELFIVFLTTNSVKSPWVNQEIGYALGKGIPVIPIKQGRVRVKGLIETAKYVRLCDNPLDTVHEIFSRLTNESLSIRAQAAIGAFVGLLELEEKYGGA